MGYTHYLRRPEQISEIQFRAIKVGTEMILNECALQGIDIVNGHGDASSSPKLTDDLICFNGVGELGHETGYLERVYQPQDWEKKDENGNYFMFCKTARKPYDLAVAAMYYLIKHVVPECELSSDGDGEGAFDEAISLCHKLELIRN